MQHTRTSHEALLPDGPCRKGAHAGRTECHRRCHQRSWPEVWVRVRTQNSCARQGLEITDPQGSFFASGSPSQPHSTGGSTPDLSFPHLLSWKYSPTTTGLWFLKYTLRPLTPSRGPFRPLLKFLLIIAFWLACGVLQT